MIAARSPEYGGEVRLGLVALNLWFLGQFLSILMPAVESAGIGQWMTSVSALLLVLAGLARCLSSWQHLPPANQQFVIAGTVILVPMTLQGVIDGMDDPLYTALQALPWYAAVFLPALGSPRLPESFLAVFRWHAFIGVAITSFFLSTNWSLLASDSVRREETLEIKVIQFLLYSLFFQVFRISNETWPHRLVALVGIAQMLIIAFGSGTRQAIVLLAVVLMLTLWVTFRSVHGMAGASAFRKFGVLLFVAGFLLATVYYIYSNLLGAVDLLNKRMTSDREGTSLRENSRLAEVSQLIDQFGPTDYMFGRGLRGEFVNTAAPKQENVHIGWFRTLLKGGVPLVLLMAIGYVLIGIRRFSTSRDGLVLACAAMAMYFAIKNSTGNIILANGHFYIVALCLGSLFAPTDPFSRPGTHRS